MKWLLFIWQLPQCLLALVLIGKDKLKFRQSIRNRPIYSGPMNYGISLGQYILMGDFDFQPGSDPCVSYHEWGHTRQSLYLGWLYLLIVGLPSIVMNMMSSRSLLHGSGKFNANYYNRWPESWADKLGGVRHGSDGTRLV